MDLVVRRSRGAGLSRAVGAAAWLSVPLVVAQSAATSRLLPGAGALWAFGFAVVTSLGFLPLYGLLMESAEARDALPEARGGVGLATALRGGAEECLFRGLVLPAAGLGPQAALYLLAHHDDFVDPGLKVARLLQCLLRGVAYGALARQFGVVDVAVGVLAYDVVAMAAVEVILRRRVAAPGSTS